VLLSVALLGRRYWKMYYMTLREMTLYFYNDERGFERGSLTTNAIRIEHALASKAVDYTKKKHVFRLQTNDLAQYLIQTR
jgi:Pleckstrin homology domain